AVPPDEHPWAESFGVTLSYREFRNRVRSYYRDNYPLTRASRESRAFNPGSGWVSQLCFEPRVGLAALEAMLAPFISSGRIQLFLRHKAIAAQTTGDRVEFVVVRDLELGGETELFGTYFLDATELGDLLP